MTNIFEIVIGDRSGDGHNQTESFIFNTNKTLAEIQEAYIQSCDLLGVRFHRDLEDDSKTELCTEWRSSELPEEVVELFIKHGVEEGLLYDTGRPEILVELILIFIGLSLKDFKWGTVSEEIPEFNSEFGNIGYGLID